MVDYLVSVALNYSKSEESRRVIGIDGPWEADHQQITIMSNRIEFPVLADTNTLKP